MGPEASRRRAILLETLKAFEDARPRDRYQRLAEQNVARWRTDDCNGKTLTIRVTEGDWGTVTQSLTKEIGVCFAIFSAGYGPDNYSPFAEEFAAW